ncbi:MAG: hypothetical protein R3E58_00670 [Phycisphaerae bacterium]
MPTFTAIGPPDKPTRTPNKLAYIQEYIDAFDMLFWIDDDAFFSTSTNR